MTPFSRFTQVYQGKNVLVLGLGVLGGASKSTITFLKAGSHVRVADIKSQTDLQSSVDILKSYPVQFVFGPHRQEDIDWAQVIVRNPSIPWHHPILEYARSQGKDIVMDAQLFIEYCGLKTIGITGTRGKSTTTLMVHAMVKSGYPGTVFRQ